MNQLAIIKQRRSIRKFNNTPVSEESLEYIIEAGRYAPTGGNTQTVHFTVVSNEEVLDKLRALVQDAFSKMDIKEGMYKSLANSIRASKTGKYVYDYNTPILVIISNNKDYPNAMADCAIAIQNMMLQATELHMGSCYINQLHWLDEDDSVREYLKTIGIGEDETICCSLALGNYDFEPGEKPRVDMKVDYIR